MAGVESQIVEENKPSSRVIDREKVKCKWKLLKFILQK